jgi:hypothetical protein
MDLPDFELKVFKCLSIFQGHFARSIKIIILEIQKFYTQFTGSDLHEKVDKISEKHFFGRVLSCPKF